MIKDLTEAISHAREVAEKKRKQVEGYSDKPYDFNSGVKKACLKCAEEYDQLAGWLTELQERREADRWIPVTERLPEKAGEYLCTLHYAIPPYHMFHPEKDIYVDDVRVNRFDGTAFVSSVVAWRPLPKPCESEE